MTNNGRCNGVLSSFFNIEFGNSFLHSMSGAEMYLQSKGTGAHIWKVKQNQFRNRVSLDLNKAFKERPREYKEIVKKGGAHVEFLTEIGIQLGPPPNAKELSLEKMMTLYHGKMKEAVEKGAIDESDLVYPAAIYTDNRGEYHFVLPGQSISANLRPLKNSYITHDLQLQMIARGFFPLGATDTAIPFQSFFWHDLAHISALMTDPQYMKGLRQLGREYTAKKEEHPLWNHDQASTQNIAHNDRFLMATELAVETKGKSLEQIQKNLSVSPGGGLEKRFSIKARVERNYQNTQQSIDRLKELLTIYDNEFQGVGGTSRDLVQDLYWAKSSKLTDSLLSLNLNKQAEYVRNRFGSSRKPAPLRFNRLFARAPSVKELQLLITQMEWNMQFYAHHSAVDILTASHAENFAESKVGKDVRALYGEVSADPDMQPYQESRGLQFMSSWNLQ